MPPPRICWPPPSASCQPPSRWRSRTGCPARRRCAERRTAAGRSSGCSRDDGPGRGHRDTGGVMRRMVLGLILAGAAIGTLVAASDPNTLTAQQKRDGWKLLFDGKTLDGWRGWKQQVPPHGWKVVDGAITRVAKAGALITGVQYGT